MFPSIPKLTNNHRITESYLALEPYGGKDYIHSAAAVDKLYGSTRNDRYVVDNTEDPAIEYPE